MMSPSRLKCEESEIWWELEWEGGKGNPKNCVRIKKLSQDDVSMSNEEPRQEARLSNCICLPCRQQVGVFGFFPCPTFLNRFGMGFIGFWIIVLEFLLSTF